MTMTMMMLSLTPTKASSRAQLGICYDWHPDWHPALGSCRDPIAWLPSRRWPQDFQAALLSADAGSDLMDPAAWSLTSPLPFRMSWLASTNPPVPTAGFLEGAR